MTQVVFDGIDSLPPFVNFLDHVADTFFKPWSALDGFMAHVSVPSLMKPFKHLESVHASSIPLHDLSTVIYLCVAYLILVAIGLRRKIPVIRSRSLIKAVATVHNLGLVALSLYMCIGIACEASRLGYRWVDNDRDERAAGKTMAKLLGVFYVSKVWEFFDTALMFLKGNYRQVSFLHCYHHISVFIIWWITTYWAPSGDAFLSACMNSFVHVVMYSYYLLTTHSLGHLVAPIKKYITQMQMLQFLVNLLVSTVNIGIIVLGKRQGTYPLLLHVILWVYMWTLLALFAHFYRGDRKRERSMRRATPAKQGKAMKEE